MKHRFSNSGKIRSEILALAGKTEQNYDQESEEKSSTKQSVPRKESEVFFGVPQKILQKTSEGKVAGTQDLAQKEPQNSGGPQQSVDEKRAIEVLARTEKSQTVTPPRSQRSAAFARVVPQETVLFRWYRKIVSLLFR